MTVNKVILIGHLGQDPNVITKNDWTVVSFSVATTESWKHKQTGEMTHHTDWHNCTAYGNVAEICKRYLHKGSKVYIEGKLRYEEYEKDGVKKYATKIIINNLVLLDKKENGNGTEEAVSEPVPEQEEEFEDNLPF